MRRAVSRLLPDTMLWRAVAIGLLIRAKVLPSHSVTAARPRGSIPEINHAEFKRLSQNGEDGILEAVFSKIGFGSRSFVEFGFGPRESSCLNLVLNHGFGGLFIDGDEQVCSRGRIVLSLLRRSAVQIENEWLDLDNVDQVVQRSGLSGGIDVLSIDVDGNDYWFWEAIESLRPRTVVIEVNSSLGDTVSVTVPYDPAFDRFSKHPSGFYCGASLVALTTLGVRKGYRLIGCDSSGSNAFFLRDDLDAPDLPTLTPVEAYFPSRTRLSRGFSQNEQYELIKDLPFVTV